MNSFSVREAGVRAGTKMNSFSLEASEKGRGIMEFVPVRTCVNVENDFVSFLLCVK